MTAASARRGRYAVPGLAGSIPCIMMGTNKMTTNRLLIALVLLVVLGIGLPEFISRRSGSDAGLSRTSIDITGMPVQGAKDAKVALVEFSDYECPFCARHATTVFPELKSQFISTGKVRYVFANFPLSNHHNARLLATAAICAGKQDAYWKMHDALFETRPRTSEGILDLGGKLGLQAQSFRECLGDDSPVTDRIHRDQAIAKGFEVSGTPSFVLGLIDAQGRVNASDVIVGAQPLSAFETAITSLLNR